MANLGSIYGTNIDGSNTLVIDFSNVQINGTIKLPDSSNNGYGISGQILQSNGSGNAVSWVTPSLPVYVSVYKNLDQIVNATGGLTTHADVIGMTIDYQSGSDYNISTGEFTAPRQGIYIIDYAINVYDNSPNFSEYVGSVVSVNRGSGFVREMVQNYFDTQQDTLLITIRAHYMTQLNAGDIVKNEIEIYGANTTIATIRGYSTTPRSTYQTIHSIT